MNRRTVGVGLGWPWSYRSLIRRAWLLSRRVPQERLCLGVCGAGDRQQATDPPGHCVQLCIIHAWTRRPVLSPRCHRNIRARHQSSAPSRAERARCANCITHARMLPMLCCSLVFWLQRRLVQWEAVCLTSRCLTYSSRAALARGFTSGRLVAVTSHWQTSAGSQAHLPSTQLRCVFATAP
jgi:hypothetical protein